jgi:hypothetical protein
VSYDLYRDNLVHGAQYEERPGVVDAPVWGKQSWLLYLSVLTHSDSKVRILVTPLESPEGLMQAGVGIRS